MVNSKYKRANSEVLHYLNGINEEDVLKIPNKFMDFLKENSDKDYVCTFDYNKSLNELENELSNEAKGIIGLIGFNYWCSTEEEKKELLKLFNENESEYQKELKERYNPDNLFKNVENESGNESGNENKKENKEISVKQNNSNKNIFSRIIEKIKNFMRRK